MNPSHSTNLSGAKRRKHMKQVRSRPASIFYPASQLPPAPYRRLCQREIEQLSASDYAIYLATIRARQRLQQCGRRNDPIDLPRPSGGYQTVCPL